MKKSFILLSFFAAFLALPAHSQTESSPSLGGCTEADLAAFAEGLKIDFEKELIKLYELESDVSAADYRRYVHELTEYKITPTFFKTNIDQFKALKISPHFLEIWNWNSKIAGASSKPGGQRPDFLTIDQKSEFYGCLVRSIQNEELRIGLEQIRDIGGLSPIIVAGGILAVDEFEEPSAQLYVALTFYYDFGLMATGLGRE